MTARQRKRPPASRATRNAARTEEGVGTGAPIQVSPPVADQKAALTWDDAPPTSGDSAPLAGFGPPRWPGDTRPPFAPGNQLAVGHGAPITHGATSPRAIAARAQQVHAELLHHAPYLAEPKFLPAVDRYLKAAAREALLHAHIEAVSAENGPGAVSSRTWEQATAATRLAAKLGSDLGLDPIGHARIRALSAGADISEATIADLVAEGAAIRRRAGAQVTAEPLDELDGPDGPEAA